MEVEITTIIEGVAITVLAAFIIWLGARSWSRRDLPKVLVHEAYFEGNSNPFYFIKVQNRSESKDFTITHTWIKEKGVVTHIINESTPLPTKLSPSDEWETWIEKARVKNHSKVYCNVRVKLSNEKTLKSKRNKRVPSSGFVSGKPIILTGTTISQG